MMAWPGYAPEAAGIKAALPHVDLYAPANTLQEPDRARTLSGEAVRMDGTRLESHSDGSALPSPACGGEAGAWVLLSGDGRW